MNARQAAFVREYLVDLNATQAAVRAGYSAKTARAIGAENLTKPDIAKAIEAAMAARAQRVEVKADDVLRELLRLAMVDTSQAYAADGSLLHPKDMPEDVRRAISGFDVEELWEGKGDEREQVGHVRKVRFWDKPRALELLGKHLKLFVERMEHSADSSFADLLKEARARAAKPD